MNTYEIYVLLIIIGIIAFGVVLKIFPTFRKKIFKDGEEIVEDVEKVLPIADKTLDTVEKIAPNSAIVQSLAELREWIRIAVGNSEQDARNGKITKGQRFDNAMEVASNVAKDLGIELDENKEMQISAAINNFCNELGHAPTDVKAIQDELEKAKADLLSSNQKANQLEVDKANVLNEIEAVKKEKDAVETQLKAIQGAVKGLTKETVLAQTQPVAESTVTQTEQK